MGGREENGMEGNGREGKGREGKGREGKGREGKGREGKRYDLRMQLQFVLYAARHDNCLLRLIWESIALYIPTNAQMTNEPAWPTISKFNVPVSAII